MDAPAISTRPRTRPAPKRRPAAAAGAKRKAQAKPVARAVARPAPKRRARQATPTRLALIPAGAAGAVGRTAGAVGGIADCGLVIRLTRGHAWIVVLGILLGGIVAINVWGLGMSASNSATAAKIEAMQRENSVLAARVASRSSNGTIEAAAAELGLAVPAADGVHYLDGSSGDAERAADRLANDKISPTSTLLPEVSAPVEPPVVTVADPAVAPVEPVDPAVAIPVDPAVAPVTTPVDPAAAPVAPTTGAVAP